MYLFKSWHESLLVFSQEQRKLLGLVALKTVRDTYLLLVKQWWFLIPVLFVPCVYHLHGFVLYTLAAVWLSQVVLSIRASINLKNYAYFISYNGDHLLIPIGVLVLLISKVFFLAGPLLPFFIFFYLDIPLSPMNVLISFARSIVFVVFNFPLMIIVYGLFFLGLKTLLFLPFGIWFVLLMLILPALLSVCGVLYTKKLHEQFDLYYFLKFTAEQKGMI